MRWFSYCKSKAFTKFCKRIQSESEFAQELIEELYESCKKEEKAIDEGNHYFSKKLTKEVSEETSFLDFKLEYRKSTAQVYEKLRKYIYEEAMSEPYLLAIVTILHFYNHFYKAKQETLNKVFASLLE